MNKNRLETEWEGLCAYQVEPNAATIALKEENIQKNRSQGVVACMYRFNYLLFQVLCDQSEAGREVCVQSLVKKNPRTKYWVVSSNYYIMLSHHML